MINPFFANGSDQPRPPGGQAVSSGRAEGSAKTDE
jgi:hypothetical protein